MLVLTRKLDQWLLIGSDIRIRVMAINENTQEIKIGIDAPRHVRIQREETLTIETAQPTKDSNA